MALPFVILDSAVAPASSLSPGLPSRCFAGFCTSLPLPIFKCLCMDSKLCNVLQDFLHYALLPVVRGLYVRWPAVRDNTTTDQGPVMTRSKEGSRESERTNTIDMENKLVLSLDTLPHPPARPYSHHTASPYPLAEHGKKRYM